MIYDWAKVWIDILGDPKLMRAARKGAKGLELTPWFITFAKKADDGGRLTVGDEPAEPDDFVTLIPGQTHRSIARALKSLEALGVLMRDEDEVLRFRTWVVRNERAPSASLAGIRERVQRHRDRREAEGEAPTVTEYVYYARAGDQVKIGRSRNPWARCSELRTARPDVVLVAVEPGDLALERLRQAEFGGRSDFSNGTRGAEWFPWSERFEQFTAGLKAGKALRSETPTAERSVTPTDCRSETVGNAAEERREEETREEESTPPSPHHGATRLRDALPEEYRADLDALLARVHNPSAWVGELTMAVEGGTAGAAVSYADLGRAIRDFKLNGKTEEPEIALLRAYIKRAGADRRRPARAAPPELRAHAGNAPTVTPIRSVL